MPDGYLPTYVYDQSAALGSLGRFGHAYTCPAFPSGCSTRTSDLGFVYSLRGEVTQVWELTPHSNGGYYHVSATYSANGLINTLNSRLGSLPTWTGPTRKGDENWTDLPLRVGRPVRRLVRAFGVHVEDVLPAPARRVRIVPRAAQPPLE